VHALRTTCALRAQHHDDEEANYLTGKEKNNRRRGGGKRTRKSQSDTNYIYQNNVRDSQGAVREMVYDN